jgi:hypothetical protein
MIWRIAALALTLLVTACGSAEPDNPDTAASRSPAATAAATPSNTPNPCLSDGGSATAPGSGPNVRGYLGLTEHAAKVMANDEGQTLRVAGRDGKCFGLTMDYNPDRVNVYLEDDQVVAATLG